METQVLNHHILQFWPVVHLPHGRGHLLLVLTLNPPFLVLCSCEVALFLVQLIQSYHFLFLHN